MSLQTKITNLKPAEAAYIAQCLSCFKQQMPEATQDQCDVLADKIHFRMGCWDIIYWFRMDNYPALNPLNAEYVVE